MKLSDYRGYTLIGSDALGEQRGLSPKNSLYSDIKKVFTDVGDVFVSELNETIILSKDAEENYKRNRAKNRAIATIAVPRFISPKDAEENYKRNRAKNRAIATIAAKTGINLSTMLKLSDKAWEK